MRPINSHLAAAAALALLSSGAHASLTLVGPQDSQGTGLGAVNTILTIQSPGNSTTEVGAVGLAGGAEFITGDAKTGASQTQTQSFADLSVTSAANLRVVFNALEPGNDANSIKLDALTLNVYNAAGTATLFTASLDHPYTFANTFTGAGNSGFVFALTGSEASELQSVFASGDRIGLSAGASDATGGFETFYVANAPTVTGAVPEPYTYALMMAGLVVVGFSARRRKQ